MPQFFYSPIRALMPAKRSPPGEDERKTPWKTKETTVRKPIAPKEFEEKSTLPKSISTGTYLSDMRRAKAKLTDALSAAVNEYTMNDKLALAKATQADLEDLKGGKEVDTTSLFNGKDLNGWKATRDPELWAVEDGVIVCKGGSKGPFGWLLTEREYTDFSLRCEFKWVTKAGNSGVAVRAPAVSKENIANEGIEIQLVDDENFPGKMLDVHHTGSIYGVHPAKKVTNKPIGEWNSVRIVCKIGTITVEYNEQKVLNSNLDLHRNKFIEYPGLRACPGSTILMQLCI
ncbi:3-keto-disaccharide hydrolase [Fimbriiglobus ruber]|uniref:3-keto-disaccharide hydrolase n=1 Tax=Fimbriiglobus ruber TaxID=1908690 RepID=UPI001379F8AB|nr:DUF1080 domain-containing protein [Fimbriiglobus ruber]